MAYQTDVVINSFPIKIEYYGFIFFATLFSYHIYYLKNKDNNWHVFYSIIGFIGALFFLIKLNSYSYSILFLIVILSVSYFLISLFNLKNKWLSIYKLFSLSAVWFFTTSIFPLINFQSIIEHPLFFIHQFVFIFLVCFCFYIRDEVSDGLKSTFKFGIIIANIALIILSLIEPGWLLTNTVFLVINIYIYKKSCTNLFYLLFVDGLLLLQSIILIWLHF